jgi:glucosamine--fructose-6-phosphate aminotransferase (isomerizing)
MCGIVGYIGHKQASNIVLNGLEALEYRGYDSAGLVFFDQQNRPELIKQTGRVKNLLPLLDQVNRANQLAIGHTRWATHGLPTSNNAHPHTNNDQTIFVVHNGIIENYLQLKSLLTNQGYTFNSETDSEVIPMLIDYYYKKLKNFDNGLRAALADLKGTYALAIINSQQPDTIYATRLSSPLVIGVGQDEHYLASDPNAILEHTKKVIFLEDYDLAIISKNKIEINNLSKKRRRKIKSELLDYDQEKSELGNYPNFMLKEIFQAPTTIKEACVGRLLADQGLVKLGGLEMVNSQLNYIDRVVIVGCGTSYYAGLVGEYLIEELANIPVEVQLASEFKYRKEPFSRSTVILAISQSGETADTMAALEKVDGYGCLKLGLVNAVGSSIARMTDAGVYCHAGPEKAVASTKAFISQVTILILIALYLSKGNNQDYQALINEIVNLPTKAQAVLDQAANIKKVALKYKDYANFLYIGRGYNYPCALEGALKLKEITYIHAEGYAAGEIKHGPLALIDKSFPTLAIAVNSSPLLNKTISNIEEIKTRGGPIIALATMGNKKLARIVDDVIYLPDALGPTQAILSAICLQLFAYYIAEAKGLNIDRPRNLAKSVTVE